MDTTVKTYQDLIKINPDNEYDRGQFIVQAIQNYKASSSYLWALDAELYSRQMNTTINRYQKLLYKVSGQAVPDNFSANHKCASNFFDLFISQEAQYLLGNGVMFSDPKLKERLGTKRFSFDSQIQDLGYKALWGAVSYGFWNHNHVDVFDALEFLPLYDEEDGAMKAGIRFWSLSPTKPLRATLYEIDGYTDWIRRPGEEMKIMTEKRPYILKVRTSEVDGVEIYGGENYPTLPIIPMWGNKRHQSELVGKKQNIDCYDLIKSGFANDLDDASLIYWTLENCGGMDDIDLAKFIQHMRTVKAAIVDSADTGAKAESHTMDVPYQSREVYLSRLESDMFRDAQAMNPRDIVSGNVTATAIRASYQSLDDKTDGFEYCVSDFIFRLLDLIGIDDVPIYKRNRVANMTEETNMVISAAQYLDTETVLRHLPFLSPDEIQDVMVKIATQEITRMEDNSNDNN